MARRLENYDWSRAHYPWHEWFDGAAWQISRPEDFDCLPRSMEQLARLRAKDHNGTVRVRHLDDDTLVVQFDQIAVARFAA